MKFKLFFYFSLMLLSINLGFSQIEVNHKDWECEFISRSVNGTFLLLDYKTKQLHLVSTSHKDSLVTPLETFNFYEMLIGLESGILKDTLHLFEHLTSPLKAENSDENLSEAFFSQSPFAFKSLAYSIGEIKLNAWLSLLHYGNTTINNKGSFWMDGTLKISPIQQLDLLKRMHLFNLPFSLENIAFAKKLFQSKKMKGVQLNFFATNTSKSKSAASWFLGMLTIQKQTYYFVSFIEMDPDKKYNLDQLNKDIVRQLLFRLQVIDETFCERF